MIKDSKNKSLLLFANKELANPEKNRDNKVLNCLFAESCVAIDKHRGFRSKRESIGRYLSHILENNRLDTETITVRIFGATGLS